MYRYKDLVCETNYLRSVGVKVFSIGKSHDNRDIICFYMGGQNKTQPKVSDGGFEENSSKRIETNCSVATEQNNNIIVVGGIHAREHISSYAVMSQVFYCCNNYKQMQQLDGGIYFVPMLNPDGNVIVERGVRAVGKKLHNPLESILDKTDARLFKANARCVDLNTNFDANYGSGKHNQTEPNFENYIGTNAMSENETRAIAEFTMRVKPKATISYHAKGQEIYYEFFQSESDKKRDYRLAKIINSKLQYRIVHGDGGSAGGYKDWCIQKLHIPSFTIELASDSLSHPIDDYSVAKNDIANNKNVALTLLQEVVKK